MRVTLKLPDSELRRLVRQATAWEEKKRKEVQKLIVRTALLIEADAKRLLSTPGSGRIYKRGSVTHQASAPGQPPAPDTGTLRASVHTDLSEIAGLVARVGTNKAYGYWLEVGTSRMAARPWLKPTYDKHISGFIEELKKIYNRA